MAHMYILLRIYYLFQVKKTAMTVKNINQNLVYFSDTLVLEISNDAHDILVGKYFLLHTM